MIKAQLHLCGLIENLPWLPSYSSVILTLRFVICLCYNVQEMANAHIELAIRLAHLLHEVWSNIRLWQHEEKKSIARLSDAPDVLDLLNTLWVSGLLLRKASRWQTCKVTSVPEASFVMVPCKDCTLTTVLLLTGWKNVLWLSGSSRCCQNIGQQDSSVSLPIAVDSLCSCPCHSHAS